MKYWFCLLLSTSIFILVCGFDSPEKPKVKQVKKEWLQERFSVPNDTTYVLNFWATWCVPCVAELPYFEKLHTQSTGAPVKVILVSLDHNKRLNDLVIPFLEKKKITAEVVLMDESDPNTWINRIDQSWSGAIPATLVFNNETFFRSFVEKELTFEQLDSIVLNSMVIK